MRSVAVPPFLPVTPAGVAIGLAVAAAIAGAARRAGSLAAGGAAAALLVGGVAVAAGWRWGAYLLVFFVSSSSLSRWRRDAKARRVGAVVEKGGARDAAQVLANGGVFALLVAAGAARATAGALGTPTVGARPFGAVLAAGAAGALAAAAADTWATEVGTAVGGTPRSLRGWRRVPAGTSGAVSLAGTAGLVAGAAAMGVLAALLGWPAPVAVGAVAGGVAGAVADTLVGAAAQAERWCAACGAATEQRVHAACGTPTVVRRGPAWLDNDAVNALCTAVGALAGAGAAALTGVR